MVATLACGTPSRRLPPRIVDDPLTLPRRMVRVNAIFEATPENEWRRSEDGVFIGVDYGITDRVTYTLPLILHVLLLDDAPPDSEAGKRSLAPVGLVLSGGIAGLGYSSSEVFIVQPFLGLEVSRAMTSRFRVGAVSTWWGSHSRLRDHSRMALRLMGTGQVSQRWAVSARLFDAIELRSLMPSSRWTRHVVGAGTGVSCRPWHWMTFGGNVWGEAVWRPQTLEPPPGPFDPLPVRRPAGRLVFWGGAWVSTHW